MDSTNNDISTVSDPRVALARAIRIAGSQAALAKCINTLLGSQDELGQSAISNWSQRGQVPAEKVIAVARGVRFGVTPHELRPDLYPNVTDGLPPAIAAFRAFEAQLDELGIVRPDERAALAAAFERGEEQLVREVESLGLTLEVRAKLLAAARS